MAELHGVSVSVFMPLTESRFCKLESVE